MIRAAVAWALLALLVGGTSAQPAGAQTPRYEGYELPGVGPEGCVESMRDLLPPAGGGWEGGVGGGRALCSTRQPPLSPPVQEGDFAGSGRLVSRPLADTTQAPPDDWLGRDKALHAGGSFLLTLSGQYVLVDKAELSNARALPISVGAALALGLLKEVADSRRERHPFFSWRDLAADAVGVALAAAVASW